VKRFSSFSFGNKQTRIGLFAGEFLFFVTQISRWNVLSSWRLEMEAGLGFDR